MTYYTKKPVTIESFQLTKEYFENPDWFPLPAWFKEAIECGNAYGQGGDKPYYTIKTLEGDMRASIGDYIIKGIKGEIYPCKPDIFEASYDVASEKPNRIYPIQIESLKKQIRYEFTKIGEKGTLCSAYLGTFDIAREYSAPVLVENYNKELGEKYSKEKLDKVIDDKLWEFMGFSLFKELNPELFNVDLSV